MRVLVTGGAGYIGAHVVRELAARGHEPVVVDDLRASSRERAGTFPFERLALEDTAGLVDVMRRHAPHAVVHMAGSISVGESVREPAKYWANNVGAASSLLLACAGAKLEALVFSSTAAVYGDADRVPIPESAKLAPTSPYGASKLAFERQLAAAAVVLGCKTVALRYFNAAGAVPEWGVGEDHDPEEHLIPRVLRALLADQEIGIYGDDWPTPDGTCVRDYVHVADLARAHVLALEAAADLPPFVALNVGSGQGASVREVVTAAGLVVGQSPRLAMAPRRPGDPPALVADPSRIRALLGWSAQRSQLAEIVADAAAWEQLRLAARAAQAS